MRDSFIFYRSFYTAISELPKENQAEVYNAIIKYALDQEETKLIGITRAIFSLIKPQLDANYKKYENGKQKKSKTEAKDKQKGSKTETNVNVNDNVNENENDNVNENNKSHFAEFVSMTNAEYEKLVSTYGKDFADQCVTELDNYKGSKGKTYKSDYRAILSWVVDKIKEKGIKPKPKEKEEQKREIYFNSNDLTNEQYVLYMQGKLTDEDIRKILEAKNVG